MGAAKTRITNTGRRYNSRDTERVIFHFVLAPLPGRPAVWAGLLTDTAGQGLKRGGVGGEEGLYGVGGVAGDRGWLAGWVGDVVWFFEGQT